MLMRSTAHVHHITQVGATDHTIINKLNKKQKSRKIQNGSKIACSQARLILLYASRHVHVRK